ncbi:hypothetical protein A3A39_03955 [Candidatus Kaiserbacteria bacterium RIFCSPLOWO2_01_FULL_54_13]|uniref:Uncharacterized protein n=1 Tax=Candidatus Kaiserbacteria bacterium RIFCSPLOWO2_01_FULL_54_13 TaxID=1798512 RepID=A0A1F6F422_9BACT|nr:MAG: hypothetical protein A3A39_03955 [Candidatus Kaiserbacteria bacterium RIFCSPLOWO2_01_FULL_54_13]
MDDYAPHPYAENIPHYHGDAVRQLFVSAAALMLIGAPFYADSLRTELPFEIAGALVLVALAALANPHKKSVFFVGAVASGVGLVVYETWALYHYSEITWLQFILRELVAVVFLVAFYFNMKTVRAFVLNTVGKHDEVGEFEEQSSSQSEHKPRMQMKPAPPQREEFAPWAPRNEADHRRDKNKKGEGEAETGPRMSPGRSPEEIKPKYHPYEYM